MTDPLSSPAAGWYQATGDPAGTVRYWNGAAWQGDAHQMAPSAPAQWAAEQTVAPTANVAPQPSPDPAIADPANVGAGLAQTFTATPTMPTPEPAVEAVESRPAWDRELLVQQADAQAAAEKEASKDPYEVPGGWLPDIGRQLAELGPRVGARMIDLLVYLALSAILSIAGSGYLLASLVPAMVFYLYEVGLTMAQGSTLGKRAMGMATIGMTGEVPPEPRAAALRALPVLLTIIPGWMGSLLWVLVLVASLVHAVGDPQRRSLADRLGSTLVVLRA